MAQRSDTPMKYLGNRIAVAVSVAVVLSILHRLGVL